MIAENEKDIAFIRTRHNKYKYELLRKNSPAETKFASLLASANIYFVREKSTYKIGRRWSYYDFYIPYYNLYVEIDGPSHDSDEQKAIDKEKEQMILRDQKYIARFTNDEVFSMESIDIEEIIWRMCVQKANKRRRHRNPESCRKRYLEVLLNEHSHAVANLIREFGDSVATPCEVWMYDNIVGEYFKFDSIANAKLSTGLKTSEIVTLADRQEYKRTSARRHVFAYNESDCVSRVFQTYGW